MSNRFHCLLRFPLRSSDYSNNGATTTAIPLAFSFTGEAFCFLFAERDNIKSAYFNAYEDEPLNLSDTRYKISVPELHQNWEQAIL